MQKKGVKIEMALIDDAKKIASEFAIVIKEIDDNAAQLDKYLEAVNRYGDEGISLYQKAQSITEKLNTSYKNLGVDPNVSTDYKSLLKFMDTLLIYRKRYQF